MVFCARADRAGDLGWSPSVSEPGTRRVPTAGWPATGKTTRRTLLPSWGAMGDRSTIFICDKLSGSQLSFVRAGDHGQMSLSQRSILEEVGLWKEVEAVAGAGAQAEARAEDLGAWVAPGPPALQVTAFALAADTASPTQRGRLATPRSVPGAVPGWLGHSCSVSGDSVGL